jgi:hypothetical protein
MGNRQSVVAPDFPLAGVAKLRCAKIRNSVVVSGHSSQSLGVARRPPAVCIAERQATICLQSHRLLRGAALDFLVFSQRLQPIRLDAFACSDTAVVLRIVEFGLRVGLGQLLVGAENGVLHLLGRISGALALSRRVVGSLFGHVGALIGRLACRALALLGGVSRLLGYVRCLGPRIRGSLRRCATGIAQLRIGLGDSRRWRCPTATCRRS